MGTTFTGRSIEKKRMMKSFSLHSRATLMSAELKKSLLKRNTVIFHTSEAEPKFGRETKTLTGTECEYQTRTWPVNHLLNSMTDENLFENETRPLKELEPTLAMLSAKKTRCFDQHDHLFGLTKMAETCQKVQLGDNSNKNTSQSRK